MDKPRLVYVPREDATPESELATLANVYRFLIECVQRRKVTEAGNDGEDAGEVGAGGEEA